MAEAGLNGGTPDLAPDELLFAVMAGSINDNTVWQSMFEPVSTFDALKRLAKAGGHLARHDQPFQVVGSDAAGVLVRTGGRRGARAPPGRTGRDAVVCRYRMPLPATADCNRQPDRPDGPATGSATDRTVSGRPS